MWTNKTTFSLPQNIAILLSTQRGMQRTLTIGRGNDHWMAGLQFNQIWFDQKRKYVVTSMYLVKQLSPK